MAQSALGLRGHMALSSQLKETANFYNLGISQAGNGQYAVDAKGGDLELLCPSFVSHKDGVFERADVKALLEYLHQPVRMAVEKNASHGDDVSKKDRFNQDHAQRTSLHRLLRFASQGSVEIPADNVEELEKETAECHAKTEQAMRDADSWRSIREIANSEDGQSVLPRSTFDPKQGFVFNLDKHCLGIEDFDGKAQKDLNSHFWKALNEATDNRYETKQAEITLTARELEAFCTAARGQELDQLLDQVEFEEAVHEKLESIQARMTTLSGSDVLNRLVSRRADNKSDDLKNVIQQTSALAPLMTSDMMHDMWARYHFTDRNESPLEGLSKEFGVFLAVMENCAKHEHVSPVHMEAIAQEFYPLLAFSEKALKTMEETAHDLKNESAEQQFGESRAAIANASVFGVHMNPDQMKGEYDDVLDLFERTFHRGAGGMSQLASAGAETAVEFTMDVVNFIKESPRTAAIFAGLATTLYMMNGGDQQTAQSVNDTILLMDEFGMMEEVPIDLETLPEEARDVQSWHWDMGPLGLYKHYMYDNAVVGPAQTIMDWMRIGVQGAYDLAGIPTNTHPVFSDAAENAAKPVADNLFRLNLFQNVSHAAFWMYMVSKGYNHGFKGAKRVFELLGPMNDLAVQAGHNMGEVLHLKKRTGVSDRLMQMTEMHKGEKNFASYEGNAVLPPDFLAGGKGGVAVSVTCPHGNSHQVMRRCMLVAMAETARDRAAVEQNAIDRDGMTTTTIKLPHLKQEFEIHSNNFVPLMNALDQFDLAMSAAADRIGADEQWVQRYMIEQINVLRDSLQTYQKDGDAAALQEKAANALEDIMGTQLRIWDESPVLHELVGEQDEEKLGHELLSRANAEFGRGKRKERMSELRDRIKNGDENGDLSLTGHLKTRLSMAGTQLWGGMVETARTIGKSTKFLRNKTSAVALGGLTAAAVAMDMAGGGNAYTDAVSQGAGTILSTAATGATFLVYNFWEDVLGVHVGGGAMLMAAGAAAGYAYKRGMKPASLAGAEGIGQTIGKDIVAEFDKISNRIGAIGEKIGDKFGALNQRIGAALTPEKTEEPQAQQQPASEEVKPQPVEVAMHDEDGDDHYEEPFSCHQCPFYDDEVSEHNSL